jgi:hypothetical protein
MFKCGFFRSNLSLAADLGEVGGGGRLRESLACNKTKEEEELWSFAAEKKDAEKLRAKSGEEAGSATGLARRDLGPSRSGEGTEVPAIAGCRAGKGRTGG